jgi:hypothetical protein
MVNQNTPVTGIFYCVRLCPLPLNLSLFKTKAHICTPKMAEDGLSLTLPPPMAYTKLYNKFPFSALHHVSLFEIYGPAAVPVMWILEV